MGSRGPCGRTCGAMVWLMCAVTYVSSMESFIVSANSSEFVERGPGEVVEIGEGKGSLGFEDWSRIVATELLLNSRYSLGVQHSTMSCKDHKLSVEGHGDEQVLEVVVKEMEHRAARDNLQKWLTPTDKWHFIIGYTNMRAFKLTDRLTQGARVNHFPNSNSSLQFFLTFISTVSAKVMCSKPIFHVVEPLLPYLKIEDLTLGKLIRDHEDGNKVSEELHDEFLGLKATLAHGALTMREVEILAARWAIALQLGSKDPSRLHLEHTATLRYTDGGGQIGIEVNDEEDKMFTDDILFTKSQHRSKTNSAQAKMQSASTIQCESEVGTAIVCSPIIKSELKNAAHYMAAHAVVQLVELNPRYEVFNKWAKYVTQSVTGNRLTIFNNGLLGQGEVIACADTGIDMDHCFFKDKHRAIPFNSVDLQARKVVQYVMSWGDKTDFAEGHGTHVVGSIAGDTVEGSHEFAGMAPAAKIAFFDLGSNSSNLQAPVELGRGIFKHGFTAGARIFSNSWGVVRQGYSSNSHDVDSFSYLNEDVLIIFAVGNEGVLGRGTVAMPASSKNCLAVGASFNAAGSIASLRQGYSRNLMKPSMVAPFSSAGPTIDGRIKPDVLAPGMVVWSSVPDFQHGPPQKNCQIGSKQGTSSSTPLVAGLASLVRQYFREGYYPSGKKSTKDGFIPSGALLKAMMIHSAVPEQLYVNSSGMNDLQLAPDYVQGYGLVVLEKVLVFAKPSSKHQPSRMFVQSGRKDGAVIKHGSVQTFTIRVTSSKEPLRVTMVWMDPPAAPSSLHPMVNDLNLKAQGPDNKTFHPNGLDKEDSINNVEVIHVMKPKKGIWNITVEGARVVLHRQPYTLVITGQMHRLQLCQNCYDGNHANASAAGLRRSSYWKYIYYLWIFFRTFYILPFSFSLS